MKPPELYSFAHLGGTDCGPFRLRGVGLANCLFPWARCAVASRKFGLRRIASTWPQLCHRQWMRRDPDKRCYVGLFDEAVDAVQGVRKHLLLTRLPRIPEGEFLRRPPEKPGVVVFTGMDGFFADLLDDHEYVRALLVQCTRRRHLPDAGETVTRGIAVHVRARRLPLGRRSASRRSAKCKAADRLVRSRDRDDWEKRSARIGQSAFSLTGRTTTFVRSSAPPNVRREFFGSSIADLHAMSTAKILVASASTFSMWAAYLARMPVIWPLGRRIQALHGNRWEHEPEVGFGALPDEFVSLIRRKLNSAEVTMAGHA